MTPAAGAQGDLGANLRSAPSVDLPEGSILGAGADQLAVAVAVTVAIILERAVGPLVGVGGGRLELGLQPLAGGVQPALDGPDRHLEPLGDLDQRLALDVEGDQGLAVDTLQSLEGLPEPPGALAGD